MGRADLSRHRGTHPADSRQTVFHRKIQGLLQQLTQSSSKALSEAASSLLNATTQRQQQTAIKALCATLQNTQQEPTVGTVLGEIMLLPDATAGIVSTVLRGCIRASIPEQVLLQFDHMYTRLGNVQDFPNAVADMRLAACLLSEQKLRIFILGHDERVDNVISHICQLLDIYLKSSSGDGSEAHDAQLLPDACDSAMKASQDTLNFLHRSGKASYNITKLVTACERVLGIEFVPRSCALACGVAYVTGRAYCASANTLDEVACVTTDLLRTVDRFPPFSRLALLRALMEAPATRPALGAILFPSDEYPHSIFASLAAIITANADVHLRFLAMDTLIACIRRAKPLPTSCRDVALSLVYERWQEPFPGVTSQIRETIEALVATDHGDKDTEFWTALAEKFASGDWTVKGMHAPLGVLVRRIGAKRMLAVKENCQQLAFSAVAADYRLVKHAVDWLGSFWKILRAEESFGVFFRLTGPSLVRVLVDASNRTLRERIAEQALPEYFRAVQRGEITECANALLSYLGNLRVSSQEALARGTVSILSVARKNGAFVVSFADPAVYRLLQSALACSEEDVRCNALDLIVTSRVPTEPVSEQELNLVLGYMTSALAPGGSLADRSRFRHCMRRMYERLSTCLHAARDGSSGWWMRVRKTRYDGVRTKDFEDQRSALLRRITKFESDALRLLIASCYPGAASVRRSNALELLELQFKNLGCAALETSGQEGFISGIIVCLTDEWERPRRASLQALSTLNSLVPSLAGHEEIFKLQTYGWSLLFSPKQKDVDSGVSLLRAIFRKNVLCAETEKPICIRALFQGARYYKDKDDGTLYVEFEGSVSDSSCPSESAALRGLEYINHILSFVKTMIRHAESNMNGACQRGLFHGLFLLLRCAFQDMPWNAIPLDRFKDSISSCMDLIMDVSWNCVQIAMRGVSFKASETFIIEGEDSDDAHFLDNDAASILLKETYQLESSGCFHSLKELCIAIGVLSNEVSVGQAKETNGPRQYHLEARHVLRAGDMFLHIFRNTRHWGVLDGAAEGFQLLCESLLRCSSGNLRSLPQTWSRETVHLALDGGLYVLRRSAGVPAVITGIVNAEGNCNRRSYEAPLLHETCKNLLIHLENSCMFTNERILPKDRSKEEESVAHALNILRSLFLNSNVATTILRHLERAAICCLKAFGSASWLIRNSAMMLFSAIVRRGIGVCGERRAELATSSFESATGTSAMMEGEGRLRGTTAFQFFSRHPGLHPFLLKVLQDSITHLTKWRSEDLAALYPALYLLSCLSPASTEDPSSAISMKPFRAIVRQCSHWRSNYVRRIAAVAYVPMLEDPSHIANAVEEILSEVPAARHITEPWANEESPQTHREYEDKSVSEVNREYRFVQNQLHGNLLTLSAILARTRALMSFDDANDTVRVLVDMLPSRIWIATNGRKNPCSYTRAAMVGLLSEAYALAKYLKCREQASCTPTSEANTLIDILTKVRRHLIDFSEAECGFGAPIGMASLRRKAGNLLLKQSLVSDEGSIESFCIAVTEHLEQANSANRDTVLTGIQACEAVVSVRTHQIEWSRASNAQIINVVALFQDIWRCSLNNLQRGADQELIVAALQLQIALLDSVRNIPSANIQVICDLQHAEILKLVEWSRFHACVDILEFALTVLGRIVSQGICSLEVVKEWMCATEAASLSQATTTRIASCTTLDASGLVKNWNERPSRHDLVCRSFLVLSRLLEDDHVDVRRHALKAAQQYIAASFRSNGLSLNYLPSLMKIYTILGSNFSDCKSLLSVFGRRLGKIALDASHKEDLLTKAIAITSGSERNTLLAETVSHSEKSGTSDSRKNPSRLFRLEDTIDDGEPLLRLHLLAYCFRDVILSKKHLLSQCDFLENMLQHLVSDLKSELLQHSQPPQGPIICGSSFSSAGFSSSVKVMLRLFLGICCICAADLPETMSSYLHAASKDLREIGERERPRMHPVLHNVLDGICIIMEEGCSEQGIRSARLVLFLLEE